MGGVFPRGGWFWNPLWEALVRTYSKPSERVGRGSRWNWVVSRCEEITRFVDKNSAGRLYGACCSVLHNRDKSEARNKYFNKLLHLDMMKYYEVIKML